MERVVTAAVQAAAVGVWGHALQDEEVSRHGSLVVELDRKVSDAITVRICGDQRPGRRRLIAQLAGMAGGRC